MPSLGGGGEQIRADSPPENFAALPSNNFAHFYRITFKLAKFINFRALFSPVSIDIL